MGPSFNRHARAIDWIASRLRGPSGNAYFDEVRSATYCDDLNRVFTYFWPMRFPASITSADRAVTLYQIGQTVNKVGGYDARLLLGCPRLEAGPIPPRAGNVSMNSSKLHELMGEDPFRPWPACEDLMPTNPRGTTTRKRLAWLPCPGGGATLSLTGDNMSVVEEILDDLCVRVER